MPTSAHRAAFTVEIAGVEHDLQVLAFTVREACSRPFSVRTLPDAFWLNVGSDVLESGTPLPKRFDSPVVPPSPIAIKAGDPVGYLGLYEVPAGLQGGKSGAHQVHLEIFTCDSEALNSFLDTTAGLTGGKQFLEIPAWTPIFEKQPIPASITQIYLHRDHVCDLNGLPVYKDKNGVEWYEVALQEKSRSVAGLINKAQASGADTLPRTTRIISQHDLRKIGWRTVQESDANSSGYLDAERIPHFFESLNPARDNAFAQFDANDDCRISASELKASLRNPALRPHWSKLIALHPTEWKAKSDSPKLQRFRELLAKNPEALRHESERIDNLVFWDEIAEKVGLPVDGRVWHFHPVELLGHFIPPEMRITRGQVTYDAEGNDIKTSHSYSRVIHWPGTEGSGVTIGRGYDMGSRTEIEIYNHLIGAGLPVTQASKMSKAHGLKGQESRKFVLDNKHDIGEISAEQQIFLFELIYPAYIERAIRVYNKYTRDKPGRWEWDALSQPVRDILVDFVYQGLGFESHMMSGMNNDVDEIIRFIENNDKLMRYEDGRNRIVYLQRSKLRVQ